MHQPYPSDVSRKQFEKVRPFLEKARKRTKPCTLDLYEVFCAVLYVLKSGCQWRMLPSDFPRWQSCYAYFRKWSESRDDQLSLLEQALEPVYDLLIKSARKARTTMFRLVLSLRSQFFQRRRDFSSQPKDRSTTHLLGKTEKVWSSLRFTTSTVAPMMSFTAAAKGSPV